MKLALFALTLGLCTPSAFANQYVTGHMDCENGPKQLDLDLKHNCKRFLERQRDVVVLSLTTIPEVAGKENDKITDLTCGYKVTYVCALHMKDSCDQAVAKRMAITEGYAKALKSKDEDPQVYKDGVAKADAEVTVACKLKAPVRTALQIPTATVAR